MSPHEPRDIYTRRSASDRELLTSSDSQARVAEDTAEDHFVHTRPT